ncbi:MAG: hypothetical protein WBS17_09885 [Candidatus Acidiferrales bacterium]
MDALAATAIQRVLMFAPIIHLKLDVVRLRTPEALLDTPHNCKTSPHKKSRSDFL